MAEQEIAKHTKKVLNVLGNREHGVAHKLREMALEVVTIVFAVTLSIWLHGLSEHRHQQEEVRSFLLGLRHDLKEDLAQVEDVQKSYRSFDANFAYLASLPPGNPPDVKKFEAAYYLAQANRFFLPTTTRFEGFKSSGKLTNIENEQLMNDIQTLYHGIFPVIKYSENGWNSGHQRLITYLEQTIDDGDDLAKRYDLIVSPKGKRILKRAATYPQLYERYGSFAELAKKIVAEIEVAYPEAAAS
jgi:hypothetical protein